MAHRRQTKAIGYHRFTLIRCAAPSLNVDFGGNWERNLQWRIRFKLKGPVVSRTTDHVSVSEGLSNKEIGRRLNIADGTIKQHLHHIYQKLEISNRTVLAALAIAQNGSTSVRPVDQFIGVRRD